MMAMTSTSFDLETFSRDGIVFPAGRIDVTGFDARYRAFQAESRRLRGKETWLKPHLVSAWLDQVVRHAAILAAVESVIGPDIVLWESDWTVKRAGSGDYIPWHQDSPYWNLSTDEVVTIWLAISDVSRDNGAMEVVPGSHRDGQIGEIDAAGKLFDAYSAGQRTTDPDCMFPFAHLDASYAVNAIPVELGAGEFSIHCVHLVHGGGPNPSADDRIGFAMRFISADTRYRGEVDSVTPIQGNCERDHFVLEQRPSGEFQTHDLVALERALRYPSGFGESKRLR